MSALDRRSEWFVGYTEITLPLFPDYRLHVQNTVIQILLTRPEAARQAAEPEARSNKAGGTSNLYYHGGTGGIGVETVPKIYVVLWGSQWNNNGPSGEESILHSFYSGVGGSSSLNSVTQYCQGVTSFCNGADTLPVTTG